MNPKRILIIRPGALGDTILTLPLVESIRRAHPDARITFAGARPFREILPPDLEFSPFDSRRWVWLFSDTMEGRPTEEPPYAVAYVILKNPDRVARNLHAWGTGEVLVARPEPREGVHIVESLHESLGLPLPEPGPCLRHLAGGEKSPLIWIHPGSGGPRKVPSLGLFASVAQALKERTGFQTLVTAGEEDAFLLRDPHWKSLTDAAGTVLMANRPLTEVCALGETARIFLGADSGISHLAAALGVPAAVFFVATSPEIWRPWTLASAVRIVDLRGPQSCEEAARVALKAVGELL